MVKIAYHNCFGGFGIYGKTYDYLRNFFTEEELDFDNVPRHHPKLIEALEKYPIEEISLIEIQGNRYWIEEYDGLETVCTPETIPWIEV